MAEEGRTGITYWYRGNPHRVFGVRPEDLRDKDADCFVFPVAGEGLVTWNIVRIREDASSGKFGSAIRLPMDHFRYDLPTGKLLLHRERVDWIKEHPHILNSPALAIAGKDDPRLSIICFCDGNHRIAARLALGLSSFETFVVPAAIEHEYRITF
jgi:hypothetical protein